MVIDLATLTVASFPGPPPPLEGPGNEATLTGAIDVALGSGAAAVFTNSPPLWDKLHMVTSGVHV